MTLPSQVTMIAALVATLGAPPFSQYGEFSRNAEPARFGPSTAPGSQEPVVTVVAVGDDSADGYPAVLRVQSGSVVLERRFEFGLSAEVLWSPDPHTFAVTGSAGGANGQYRTAVVTVTPAHLTWVDVTPAVERAFGHPVKCGWPEAPNVGAVKWLSRRQLLVVAQIIGHSNCDSFGTFTAYAIDVTTRRIERRFDQLETKRRWGSDLGIGPAGAPDECIRRPRSCYVPANHAK